MGQTMDYLKILLSVLGMTSGTFFLFSPDAVSDQEICMPGRGTVLISSPNPVYDKQTGKLIGYEDYKEPILKTWSDTFEPLDHVYFQPKKFDILPDRFEIYYLDKNTPRKKDHLKSFPIEKHKNIFKVQNFNFSKYMAKIPEPDGEVYFVFKNQKTIFCKEKISVVQATEETWY